MTKTQILILHIPRSHNGRTVQVPVADYAEASAAYAAARDDREEGVSSFGEGKIKHGSVLIAKVSYNGKVWNPTPWKVDDVPLYVP